MGVCIDPIAVPLSRPADLVLACRYDPDRDCPGCYTPLPNVRCVSVTRREGAQPSVARFRYAFDDRAPLYPRRVEDVWGKGGDDAVATDDRLVVLRLADGADAWECLFDGFALCPQIDLNAAVESVTFEALGVEVREWDTPLDRAVWRDGDTPTDPSAGHNRAVALPIRFNPDGAMNAADLPDCPVDPEDATAGSYPAFFDPKLKVDGAGDAINLRYWTLPMAVRYCIARGITGGADPTYVAFDAYDGLDGYLKAARPTGTAFDWSDAAGLEMDAILVKDVDVTGDAWPVAVAKLCEPHGFFFRFDCHAGADGKPATLLRFYRKDDAACAKAAKLQKAGEVLDPGRTNLAQCAVRRDAHEIANVYAIDAGPERYEVGVVLAPGFEVAAADAGNPEAFARTDPGYDPKASNLEYRSFVADECGEGHWDWQSAAWQHGTGWALDLRPAFSAAWRAASSAGKGAEDVAEDYAHRRRPGLRTLISTDELGRPLEARLDVAEASAYAGDVPGLYDESKDKAATNPVWVEVARGGWKLDPDRLGILVTASDPNSWNVGNPESAVDSPYLAGGLLNLVECLAAPTAGQPRLVFRLTCVIEADEAIPVESSTATALASPTSFKIRRRLDVRDRYHQEYVTGTSIYAEPDARGLAEEPTLVRDDRTAAVALAEARARYNALPPLGGSMTVPRVTTAYSVGDKIKAIDGRGIDLAIGGGAAGGSPVYPSVVAVTWDLDGRQATTLQLSDYRGDPDWLPPDLRTAKARRSDHAGGNP